MEYLSQFYIKNASRDNVNSLDPFRCAIIKIIECIDTRHLFEQIITSLSKSLDFKRLPGPVTNIAELMAQIQQLFEGWDAGTTEKRKFVLVLDGIEKQKNAIPGLFAALARINDMVNLQSAP